MVQVVLTSINFLVPMDEESEYITEPFDQDP